MISLGTHDAQNIFYFLETITFVLVIGIIIFYILDSKNSNFVKKYKTIIGFVFIFWTLASFVTTSIRLYTYFESTRPAIKESINLENGLAY